jgi:pilus assembly protein CpaC
MRLHHPIDDDRRTPLVRTLWMTLLVAVMTTFAGTLQADEMSEDIEVLRPSRATAAVFLEPADATGDMLRTLEIARGKSVYVKTGYNVKRVSVGDPALLDVVVLSPRELQFVAKATGTTNVLVWDTKGNPQASIEVEVGTPESYLQRALGRILGHPGIRVESAGSATVLTGTAPSALAVEQAVTVAEAFVGEDSDTEIVNLLHVAGNQQVMLKVVIAEVSRNITREMGVNFNALIDAGGGQIGLTGLIGGLTAPDGEGGILLSEAINLAAGFSSFGSLELLEVFLDILDRRGLTKILAEPTLIARSGEPASFLVGGEVPIPIAQGGAFGSITVEYKKFGVGLAFTPTVLGPDRIHLKVAPEVSRPDFTFGTEIDGTIVPAFNTRRVATNVVLSHGQTFVIAGLLNEDLREQYAQYPLLGQIPILGNLFRSAKFEKTETELLILVTPELAKPIGSEPAPLPTDHFIEPSEVDFYLFGRLEGTPPADPREPGGLIGESGYRIAPNAKESTDE